MISWELDGPWLRNIALFHKTTNFSTFLWFLLPCRVFPGWDFQNHQVSSPPPGLTLSRSPYLPASYAFTGLHIFCNFLHIFCVHAHTHTSSSHPCSFTNSFTLHPLSQSALSPSLCPSWVNICLCMHLGS